MTSSGFVAPGWEGVRDAFEHNLTDGEDIGAGVAVYHRGQKVVDLVGGWFDADRSQPYDADTLQLVFSTTKGIAAIAVGICVQRGWLAYDQPVSRYWPEFAAKGKGEATVAQLLSHQCGLFSVQGDITLAEALDWPTITSRLADTEPEWPIGSTHGYHALTYGWLAGELVRRADPAGRGIGQFVREEIAAPLGVECYIGLPEEHEPRVSPLVGGLGGDAVDDPAIRQMMEAFMGPGTNGGRALSLNGAFTATDGTNPFNSRAVHAAEIPAANAITNAHSLARIYAATLGPVDGVQVLSDSVREVARTSVTPENEPDACLIVPTAFGMGFMTPSMFMPFAGAGSYGHPGAGGSVAFAQPERSMALGYVMNKMAGNLANDTRAMALIAAASAAADAG
ncbi:MAG TPA: esterase [Acidimicrobiaceae bacterium]|nr:esterase [Acidimicrobiaceae bacterium]